MERWSIGRNFTNIFSRNRWLDRFKRNITAIGFESLKEKNNYQNLIKSLVLPKGQKASRVKKLTTWKSNKLDQKTIVEALNIFRGSCPKQFSRCNFPVVGHAIVFQRKNAFVLLSNQKLTCHLHHVSNLEMINVWSVQWTRKTEMRGRKILCILCAFYMEKFALGPTVRKSHCSAANICSFISQYVCACTYTWLLMLYLPSWKIICLH